MPVSISTLVPTPLTFDSISKALGLLAVEALASRVAQAEAAAAAASTLSQAAEAAMGAP
jgi:hypothetical protein